MPWSWRHPAPSATQHTCTMVCFPDSHMAPSHTSEEVLLLQEKLADAAAGKQLLFSLPAMSLGDGQPAVQEAVERTVQLLEEQTRGMFQSLDAATQHLQDLEVAGLASCRDRMDTLVQAIEQVQGAVAERQAVAACQLSSIDTLQQEVTRLEQELLAARREALVARQAAQAAQREAAQARAAAEREGQEVASMRQALLDTEDALTQSAQAVARQHALIRALQGENLQLLTDSLGSAGGEPEGTSPGSTEGDSQDNGGAACSPLSGGPTKVARAASPHTSVRGE